jgi:geranylgeranyl reductase family protein
MTYDVIVVGGGPGGSTAAREAAAAGARVLLLDRASFPRDKPCGGGVNLRAARLLPFSIAPVVERSITAVRFSHRMERAFTRRYPGTLTYMTQRSRLDAYLIEQAVAAGVEVRECEPVRAIDMGGPVTVRARAGVYQAHTLIGADGANGVTAKLTGMAGERDAALALEGNIYPAMDALAAWEHTLALDLGGIPGGYGWLFPKGDHVNVGVGGWKYLAGGFRPRLDRLTRHYGFDPAALENLRGHHLPVRRPGAPLARGPVVLVGDAAGLVDPLSGEGIYAAILSGKLAAAHLLAAIDVGRPDVSGYARAVQAALGPELRDSGRLQDVFNLVPSAYVEILRRSDRLWTWLCRIIRGEETYTSLKRRTGPFGLLIDGASWATRRSVALGRRTGHPWAASRRAMAGASAAGPDRRPGGR